MSQLRLSGEVSEDGHKRLRTSSCCSKEGNMYSSYLKTGLAGFGADSTRDISGQIASTEVYALSQAG